MATPAGSAPPRPVLVVSHERSGTHMLLDLLRRSFPPCRARPAFGRNPHDWLYFNLDRLCPEHAFAVGTAFADWAFARVTRPLLKSHALPGFAGVRPDARVWLDDTLSRSTKLYVLRDCRAVMPSFHRHQISIDPLTTRNFSEFLRTPIDKLTPPQTWARHASAWTAQEGVHVVRYEAMIAHPEAVQKTLASVLSETPDPTVKSLVPPRGESPWAARLARLTGRLESSNLVEVGKRTPRWHELFTPEDLVFMDEQAGEAMRVLGYSVNDGPRP